MTSAEGGLQGSTTAKEASQSGKQSSRKGIQVTRIVLECPLAGDAGEGLAMEIVEFLYDHSASVIGFFRSKLLKPSVFVSGY